MEKVNQQLITSLSQFKANPLPLLREANNQPFVVLNHNKPAFVVLTPEIFERLIEALEDADDAIAILKEKAGV